MRLRQNASITLSGLRLGDALDAIVNEDSRYTWSEADGRIFVRAVAVGGTSALDLRVGRFEVRNSTLENAVAALIALVDARRPAPTTAHFSASLTSGPAPPPKPPAAMRRSFVFDGGTLEQALHALGRTYRASWSVVYDPNGVRLEHATLTLIGDRTIVSVKSVAAAAAGERAADVTRLLVPTNSIKVAIEEYTRRKRRVEFASDPTPGPARRMVLDPRTFLDLTGLTRAEAFDRLLALDSRLQWSDGGDGSYDGWSIGKFLDVTR